MSVGLRQSRTFIQSLNSELHIFGVVLGGGADTKCKYWRDYRGPVCARIFLIHSEEGKMKYLPLFADLNERNCLIIGGGEVAAQKIRLVLGAGARLTVIATKVNNEIRGLESAGRLRVEPSVYGSQAISKFCSSDVALIVVAEANPLDAEAWASWAHKGGFPVNVVDRPDISTVVFPGIVDRDPVLIAIGSSGTAPVLVRRLREKIEGLLPSRLGRLAQFAMRFRNAVANAETNIISRRRFWEGFFDGPVARLVLKGQEHQATKAMLRIINGVGRSTPEGSVALIGVGPGDPDLLTLRALRAMQDADVVLYDRLIGDKILDYVRRDAERIYVGKAPADQSMNQQAINALILERAHTGQNVVRLKGGDPFVFGRGGEEMAVLKEASIKVEVIPGVTAAIGCAATAGIPLTHRDYAEGVSFVTGSTCDGGTEPDWASLATLRHTLVIYMGVAKAGVIGERLVEHGMRPETPVAVIENGTLPDQIITHGTLKTLGVTVTEQCIGGPVLLIIGDVAALSREESRKADAHIERYAHAF